MIGLRRLLSPCFVVGHDDPLKEIRGKQLHLVCPRCLEDLHTVLPKQKLKVKRSRSLLRFQKQEKSA